MIYITGHTFISKKQNPNFPQFQPNQHYKIFHISKNPQNTLSYTFINTQSLNTFIINFESSQIAEKLIASISNSSHDYEKILNTINYASLE